MGREIEPDGAKIRNLREARGWQVQDLADKAECSLKTVNNVEKGRPCFKSTLVRFAKVFGVQYDALLPQGAVSTETQGTPPAKPDPLVMITINLTIPFQDFDETDELTALIKHVKGLIMKKDDFVDVTVKNGSTIIVITMTETEALQFTEAYGDGKLKVLPMSGFGIERLPDADYEHFEAFIRGPWHKVAQAAWEKLHAPVDSSKKD